MKESTHIRSFTIRTSQIFRQSRTCLFGLIRIFFLCGFAFRPHVSGKSSTFWIRSPEGKVLNVQRIWNRVTGRIRIFSKPMTLQTLIQSLPRQYLTWPLNETLLVLLSLTRTPDGACSVDNSHRGVLETRTNPDMCGRTNSIWIRYVWTWNFWIRKVAD